MKWTKSNKVKLYSLLWKKLDTWGSCFDHLEPKDQVTQIDFEWGVFLSGFGITTLSVDASKHALIYDEDEFKKTHADKNLPEFCYESGDCVILDDPWRGGDGIGLKIPKDVAERFLILGVP